MAQQDPTKLLPYIYKTFSQGVEVDMSPIGRGVEKSAQIQREKLKNLYDINADLDAAGKSAMKKEFDDIYNKIENNELNIQDPRFDAALGKMRATANGIKEARDLAAVSYEQAINNPENVAFYGQDQYGRNVDLGIDGFAMAMSDLSSRDFNSPEEYMAAVSDVIKSVNAKVDEESLDAEIESSIEREVEKSLAAQGADNTTIKTEMDAYRRGVRTIEQIVGDSERDRIAGVVAQNYRRDLGSRFAEENYKTPLGQGITERDWGVKYVLDRVPSAVISRENVSIPASSQRSRYSGYGGRSIRLEDVTKAARDASDNLTIESIEKFIKPHERAASYNEKTNEFVFFSLDESASGNVYRKDIVTIDADDPDAIARYLLKLNEKEIDRESYDEFTVPPSDTEKAAKAREEAQAPVRMAEEFADEALSVSTSEDRDRIEKELNRIGVTDINFAGTMLFREDGIESVKITDRDGKKKTLDLTTADGQQEFKKYIVSKRDDLQTTNKKGLTGGNVR